MTADARRWARRTALAAAAVCAAAVCAAAGGCGVTEGMRDAFGSGDDAPPWRDPFPPASIRVYPLTQLIAAPDGRLALEMHLELRDRFDDQAKGLGELSVRLRAPDGFVGRAEVAWSVREELLRPELNSARFDPATDTYRLLLTGEAGRGLPAWVRAIWEGRVAAGEPDRAVVIAVFRTFDERGEEVVLRDQYELRAPRG